jgi:hypothetical protein
MLWVNFTHLAAGGAHQVDGYPAPGVQGQGPPHAKGFIIWMGQGSE